MPCSTPLIVQPSPECSLTIDDDEIAFVAEFTAALNTQIRNAAATAGVNVIDTSDAFDGRLLCDDDPATNFFQLSPQDGSIGQRILPTTWVHGVLHPRIDGHQLIADALVSDPADGDSGGELVDLLDSVSAGWQANPAPSVITPETPGEPAYQELPDREWIRQRLFETVRDLLLPVALLLLGGFFAAFGVIGLAIPVLSFLAPETPNRRR